MTFEDFARSHGLILDSVIPNRWVSTPTEDHPRKRNGRYKFLGNVGWVQNWATMQNPSMWKTNDPNARPSATRAQIQHADRERLAAAKAAADKAAWILHQTVLDTHPYLERKGFKDEVGNVWNKDGQRILVVPMRNSGRLVGCQLIDEQGNKKFLYGQQSKGASYVIQAKGLPIFVEGYATGLSVRTVMRAMKVRYTIHVCFSASNMEFIARQVSGGIVIADHDTNGVGKQAALNAGKPYWISDTVGEDFNDYHVRVGLFRASQALKQSLYVDKNLHNA